jgi:hypothetical protein
MSKTIKLSNQKGFSALQVALKSPISPLALLELDCVANPDWITVWYMINEEGLSPQEAANVLGLERHQIGQMLMKLERLRRSDARVESWLTEIKQGAQFADLTPCVA